MYIERNGAVPRVKDVGILRIQIVAIDLLEPELVFLTQLLPALVRREHVLLPKRALADLQVLVEKTQRGNVVLRAVRRARMLQAELIADGIRVAGENRPRMQL